MPDQVGDLTHRLAANIKRPVQIEKFRGLGAINRQQHDPLVVLALDQRTDGIPFQAGPLLLAVCPIEDRDHQVALLGVERRQNPRQPRAGELRFVKFVEE